MKNKLWILALSVALVACGNGGKEASTKDQAAETEASTTEALTEAATEQAPVVINEVPVRVEEIPFTFDLLDPDEEGKIYYLVTFTNNSTYTVTNLNMGIIEGDSEKVYYSCSETIRPNEKSTDRTFLANEKYLDSEPQITEIDYCISRDDDHYLVFYNYETQEYEIQKLTDADLNITKDPPVKVDDFPYEITLEEPDPIGAVYGVATFTNKSALTVSDYFLEFLLKDINVSVLYHTEDPVLPGETSAEMPSFGPPSGLEEDMEPLKMYLTITNANNTKTMVTYDFKLQRYTLAEGGVVIK